MRARQFSSRPRRWAPFNEWREHFGLAESTGRKLIKEKRVKSAKIGRCLMVDMESTDKLFEESST